jgi:hypothetical protein
MSSGRHHVVSPRFYVSTKPYAPWRVVRWAQLEDELVLLAEVDLLQVRAVALAAHAVQGGVRRLASRG